MMMAADLCERAAALYRFHHIVAAEVLSRRADVVARSLDTLDYRWALRHALLTHEQIDAAVSAIERGEWPADSLVGRIEKMRDEAGARTNGPCQEQNIGACDAFDDVLNLLGVKLR